MHGLLQDLRPSLSRYHARSGIVREPRVVCARRVVARPRHRQPQGEVAHAPPPRATPGAVLAARCRPRP